jgi:polar amino acid transport system substrate-binding protein
MGPVWMRGSSMMRWWRCEYAANGSGCLAAIACVWLFASCACLADAIALRADDWCPFNCSPDGNKPGYMVDLARLVLSKQGHTLDYRLEGWSRALSDARDGHIQAVVGATADEVRRNGLIADLSAPLGRNLNCFIVKQDSDWRFSGLPSLLHRHIGIIQDYAYGEQLDAYFRAHTDITDRVTGDDPLKRNLEKLASGRIDTLVEDRSVLQYALDASLWKGRFSWAGCEDSSAGRGLYIAFSPRYAKAGELSRALVDGVHALRKDGTLKAVLDKYHVSDWQP